MMNEKPVEIKSVGSTDVLYPIINKLPQFSTAVEFFFHNANLKISLFFFEFRKILKSVIFFRWELGEAERDPLRDGFPKNWNGVGSLADIADRWLDISLP